MKKLLLLIGSVLLLSLPLKADLPGQPANSWVHGKNWYCNNGYEKKNNKCVSIFDDSQSEENTGKKKSKEDEQKEKAAKEKAAKEKAAKEKARKEKAAKEKVELNKTYDLNEINKERLKDLKELFEEELINEQEYNQKKQGILDLL